MKAKGKGYAGCSKSARENAKSNMKIGLFLTVIILLSNMTVLPSIYANPIRDDFIWSDTFGDTNGLSSLYNVNVSEGNISLKGYRSDFEDDSFGEIPVGWVREYADAGSDFNKHVVNDNPFETTRSVYMLCNNDLSSFAWQKLWKEFNDYFRIIEFELTLKTISSNAKRQGYFYLKFFDSSDVEYHEVRYYWDHGRSGIPSNSSSLTTNDLIEPLPVGNDLGIKYFILENISEDIDDNPSADLSTILGNMATVRYGFYQDCGPDWDTYEQVYVDNVGIYNDHNGNVRSIEIIPPLGYNWISLDINKTEHGSGAQISVSVLDGTTDTIIPGFGDLVGTSIDLSSIDTDLYLRIRLQADLIGTVNSTPILHDWIISWANIRPPESPTGLVVSNPLNGYSLILSWHSNVELDMDYYKLYYSLDNITFDWLVDVPPGTISFVHYGLMTGTTYYYLVVAVDTASNYSPNSTIVEGTPDIDSDNDGIGNIPDPDDDNDGILDFLDPYPLNPLNDMEIKIDDIQSILSGLNLTDLLNAIDTLNQSLPPLVDDLNKAINNFSDLNISDIMTYLKGMNTTLYNEIQNLLTEISEDISEMMISLKMLEENLTTQHDSLNSSIDILKNLIQNEHIQTRDEILVGLNNVLTLLKNLDNNMTTHDGDIKNLLGTLDNLIQNENNMTRDQLIENATEILNQLQIVDQNILNELAAMDTSISSQLNDIMDNITTNDDALRTWLELVLASVDSNLNNTRLTLENQLSELNMTISNFSLNLNGDLANINSLIQQHDDDTGQDHSNIITYLDDLLNNDDLQSLDLSSLKTMLINLAGDLSTYNQSIENDIMDVVDDINEFEENTENQMKDIDNTLDNLEKLQNIIEELYRLSQTLDTVNKDLEESIEDKSAEKEIEDRVKFVEMLMMLVIILLIVNLVLTLVMGMRKKSKEDMLENRRHQEETKNMENQIQEKIPLMESQHSEPPIIEDKVFPPPPPSD